MSKETKKVYDVLYNAIVCGKLVPGERIVEEDISNRFNVSRTPVRRALQELEQNKLIRIEPYRGAFVYSISYKEAADLLDLVAVFEEYLCSNTAKNVTKKEIKILHKSLLKYEDALARQDLHLLQRSNFEFHSKIAEFSQNQLAQEIYQNLQARMNMIRIMTLPFSNRDKMSLKEHRDIFRAIENKEQATAAKKALAHVEAVSSITLEILKNKSFEWHGNSSAL